MCIRSRELVVEGGRGEVLGDVGGWGVVGLPVGAGGELLGIWDAIVGVAGRKGGGGCSSVLELLGWKLIRGMRRRLGRVWREGRGCAGARLGAPKDGLVCSSVAPIWRLSGAHRASIHCVDGEPGRLPQRLYPGQVTSSSCIVTSVFHVPLKKRVLVDQGEWPLDFSTAIGHLLVLGIKKTHVFTRYLAQRR
jgi:hypothetical protein